MSDSWPVTDAKDGAEGRPSQIENRTLEARLRLILDSLTASIVFNPAGGALTALCFLYAGKAVGGVPVRNLAVAVGLMCLSALAAFLVRREFTRRPHGLLLTQRVLAALQVFISLIWGAFAWLLWRDGHPVNNMFVAAIMVSVVWAAAFTRSAHKRIFLSGVLTLAAIVILRFATASGIAAHILAAMMPLWTGYIVIMGLGANRRVDEMMRMRFANEDLSRALRRTHDDALKKRYEAEAANASKTAFLANMSHELRTPLNAILGFSEIIAHQSLGVATERYAEYARDIHASGTHLLSIINDLLDVAKIEAGRMEIDPQPLNPAHPLASVERLMVGRARAKQIAMHFPRPEDAPWVVADERAFKQIALNLLSNAVKFTPEGGRIDIRCRRDGDGGFVLSVEDTGPGIAPEKQERVFQAFNQVDNRYDRNAGGTGLGLALVRGLAELHGGRAWIESEPGAGTTVLVYFPLGIEPSGAAIPA